MLFTFYIITVDKFININWLKMTLISTKMLKFKFLPSSLSAELPQFP